LYEARSIRYVVIMPKNGGKRCVDDCLGRPV